MFLLTASPPLTQSHVAPHQSAVMKLRLSLGKTLGAPRCLMVCEKFPPVSPSPQNEYSQKNPHHLIIAALTLLTCVFFFVDHLGSLLNSVVTHFHILKKPKPIFSTYYQCLPVVTPTHTHTNSYTLCRLHCCHSIIDCYGRELCWDRFQCDSVLCVDLYILINQ